MGLRSAGQSGDLDAIRTERTAIEFAFTSAASNSTWAHQDFDQIYMRDLQASATTPGQPRDRGVGGSRKRLHGVALDFR